MIKHIKRKTVKYFEVDWSIFDKPSKDVDPSTILKGLKYNKVKNLNAIQFMDTGEALYSFFYNDNGNTCTVPLANPVLIYFNLAQTHLRNIHSRRSDLLGLFRDKKEINEDSLKIFYDFFGLTSSFITMLMTAIEAFVNQQIDKDYKLEMSEQKRYTKIYDYDQILRWVTLDDKIEHVLNKKHSKNFSARFKNRYIHISNLKELRDQIIHTKAGINYNGYIELFRRSLNFKFDETIEAVRDFINFYDDGLIEPCPCGLDI